jgi:hypothetical protein
LLACFVPDKESKYSQEEGVHGDVKDEFDELARALEGVKEDLVLGVKVNYPELKGENGTEHQSN